LVGDGEIVEEPDIVMLPQGFFSQALDDLSPLALLLEMVDFFDIFGSE
jgi:hypothetical protein